MRVRVAGRSRTNRTSPSSTTQCNVSSRPQLALALPMRVRVTLRDADVVTVRDRDGMKDLEPVTAGVTVPDLD